MKKRTSTIYAILCTLLLAAGFAAVFFFAWKASVPDAVKCLVGLVLGFILTPIYHEIGHVVFAKAAKMDCVYVKCFCLRFYRENGKRKIGLTSPFAPDETQVLPKRGGDMQKRAAAYSIGGLAFGLLLILLIVACAVCTQIFLAPNYLLWGLLPYPCYSFLLNAAPAEYPGGKTDTAVYIGLKKGYDAEKNMLAAMEIQGQLSEGRTFAEIDETLYFDQPQLCEDEPLFAVMLDLKYRYYLEKGDMEKAAACLNRLASVLDYMPLAQAEKVAAELVYMASLRGEMEIAEENAKACQGFLKGKSLTAKRILAAWSKASGQTDFVDALLAQAQERLDSEQILGVRKFEEILLSRMER
jgi:hypothetical protein